MNLIDLDGMIVDYNWKARRAARREQIRTFLGYAIFVALMVIAPMLWLYVFETF